MNTLTAIGQPHAPSYPISSVDNALRLLLLLRTRQVMRVSDASSALGCGRSTAHRLFAMLMHYGFARQDPDTRAYLAAPLLNERGLPGFSLDAVRQRAHPYLQAIAHHLHETSHLCVLQGTSVFFVDSVGDVGRRGTGSRVGVAMPAHCTSPGKVLLAHLPSEALARLYEQQPFVRLTSASVRSVTALEHEAARIRARGFAVNFGESESNISSVSVIVHTPDELPAMALTLSAPIARLTQRNAVPVARSLRKAADGLEQRLRAP